MPANLTPQYLVAEGRYRAARTPEDQLAALEEMWRELPKHKSTEKMQAELKKKLSAVRKLIQQGTRKVGGKTDPFAIARGGAGQVVLLGTPNTGKSSLLGALSHAHVRIADYPFSTELPVPGMVPFEDVQVQVVDTPPITADHVPTGSAGLWHSADALVIVADLAADTLLEDAETCLRHLAERHVLLVDGPRQRPTEPGGPLRVPGLVLANKADAPGAAEALELLRELCAGSGSGPAPAPPPFEQKRDGSGPGSSGPAPARPSAEQQGGPAPARPSAAAEQELGRYGYGGVRVEPVSTRDPASLARLPGLLFGLLHVVRVYAKPPGRKPDLEEPFVLPAGSDVHELARHVYRGFEQRVHAARIWGSGHAAGQNVQLDHVLHDKDIIELHT